MFKTTKKMSKRNIKMTINLSKITMKKKIAPKKSRKRQIRKALYKLKKMKKGRTIKKIIKNDSFLSLPFVFYYI